MTDLKRFNVELEVTRVVTVTVEAADGLAARERVNNLEYDLEVESEVIRWVVKRVVEAPT